jgi:hypothetical protein
VWSGQPRRDTLRPWPGGGVGYLATKVLEDYDPPDEASLGWIMHEGLHREGAPEPVHRVSYPRNRSVAVGTVGILTRGPHFAPRATWDLLPDGRLVVADQLEYRIQIHDPGDGSTVWVGRPIEPRTVTERDREGARDQVREAYSGRLPGVGGTGTLQVQQIDAIVAAMEFAERIPVVLTVRVDDLGRIWAQRAAADYHDDRGPIDILRPTGEYLGTLRRTAMPAAFGPRGLVAWMDTEGEADRVRVARVPPSLR